MAGQSLAFAPHLGHAQSVTPVGLLKGMVIGEVLRHGLLHGCLSEEFDGLALAGVACLGEVGHEEGGGLHLFAVFLQCLG